jgi:hypothetical protein
MTGWLCQPQVGSGAEMSARSQIALQSVTARLVRPRTRSRSMNCRRYVRTHESAGAGINTQGLVAGGGDGVEEANRPGRLHDQGQRHRNGEHERDGERLLAGRR